MGGKNRGMSTGTRTQRRYDHRLRELVRAIGKIDVALESGVPRSTAYGWLASSHADVVTLDLLESDVTELQREVFLLRRRNAMLVALLRLVEDMHDLTLSNCNYFFNSSTGLIAVQIHSSLSILLAS